MPIGRPPMRPKVEPRRSDVAAAPASAAIRRREHSGVVDRRPTARRAVVQSGPGRLRRRACRPCPGIADRRSRTAATDPTVSRAASIVKCGNAQTGMLMTVRSGLWSANFLATDTDVEFEWASPRAVTT